MKLHRFSVFGKGLAFAALSLLLIIGAEGSRDGAAQGVQDAADDPVGTVPSAGRQAAKACTAVVRTERHARTGFAAVAFGRLSGRRRRHCGAVSQADDQCTRSASRGAVHGLRGTRLCDQLCGGGLPKPSDRLAVLCGAGVCGAAQRNHRRFVLEKSGK